MSTSREEILRRVEEALLGRPAPGHPGSFSGGSSHLQEKVSPVERFKERFERAGGEVLVFSGSEEARSWLQEFSEEFESISVGETVPESLCPLAGGTDPGEADLGISMARCAIAETGSLVLDARDGRRTQLLPPTHLVLLPAERVYVAALEALLDLSSETLPSALGFHSGPSKSADIGQIMVRGIHGPGRLIAGIIE
jgi:L-lactate dehydrogenase complex protein LldG